MADKKISALTGASTPLAGTEVLPIVQGGATVKVAVSDLTAGRAVSALSTTVTGNSILNGALASDVGLLKNIGRGYGVSTERWIGSDGTFTTWFYNAPTGGNHYFAINSVNKLEVVGDNVNIPVGNLVQGTAAKGVNFTANTGAAGKTSNLLNWYEEGTWTPVVSGTSTAGTYEFAINGSKYTRVGRTVTLQGFIRFAAAVTGGGAGALSITGLPFSKSANSYPVGGVYLALGTWSGNHPTVVFGSFAGSSQLLLQQDASGGYGTNVDISYASANAYLTFTITYEV